MNTFIISAKTLQNGIDRAILESEKNKIDEFDIQLLEFEKALGIEDVRKIQEKIFLRPFKGDKKAVLIIMSNGATVDAQNAMLKLLEEPPASTLIFLITDNHLAFLPTVLSRTKIIEIKEEKEINSDGLEKILNLNGAGERLHLAQVIYKLKSKETSNDKTEIFAWLEKAILAAREKMLEKVDDKQEALKFRKIIHQLELTHYDLKTTNANPRLALENLFLTL